MIPGTGWRLRLAAVAVTLVASALVLAERFEPSPAGLRATYFANPTWSTPPALAAIDRVPSTLGLIERWDNSPPEAFSVVWTGWIVAPRDGDYTLGTVSDDGSQVFVDGRLVVDNGGTHAARLARGAIRLTRGVHPLLVEYFQAGSQFRFELLWARGGAPLAPVPGWALRTRAGTLAQAAGSVLVDAAAAAGEWLSIALLAVAIAVAVWPLRARLTAWLARESAWPALGWIVLGSLALNVAGFWWGLPGTWAPIEVTPRFLVGAVSQHFSGGWFEAYPPLHLFVLTLATGPILLLDALGRLDVHGVPGFTLLLATSRLVSVAAAAGTVVAAGVCGTRAFGRRAGLFAAATFALVAPFVYYAKTANVDAPYVFWWALSMIFYLRLLDDGSRVRDYALFAVFAACAVCTKDQAYGLYALLPAPIVYRLWREHRGTGRAHPLRSALADPRLVAAAGAAAVSFALFENLIFNFAGFLAHVRFIVGPGNAAWRMVQPTVGGHWTLMKLTARLVEESFGWPLFLACAAGLASAAAAPRLRGTAAWLLAPAASYYVSFIAVILYDYDRFVLPVCWLLALFGGLAFDRFVRVTSGARLPRVLGAAGLSAAFAYSLLYAGAVDVLMIHDSRYAVQRWMAAHVSPDVPVGIAGPTDLLPTLDSFHCVDVPNIEWLKGQRPAYYVLNADYAHAVPPETGWGELIAGLERGTLGYRLVLRVRRPLPWAWLPGGHPDLVGPRDSTAVVSILDEIDPTIEVFRREGAVPRPMPVAARR